MRAGMLSARVAAELDPDRPPPGSECSRSSGADTIDPKHYATKERPAYPTKLSRRPKRELTGRVFNARKLEANQNDKHSR